MFMRPDIHKIESLLATAGVESPWKVDREPSNDDEFSEYVVAYETPVSISPVSCATRVLGFGVRTLTTGVELVRRQEEWHLAVKPCSSVGLDDFRPVAGAVSEQELASMVRLLGASVPSFGGFPRKLRFESDDLELVFRSASPSDLVFAYLHRNGNVDVTFAPQALTPDFLGVQIVQQQGSVTEVFLYRQSGPSIVDYSD